MRTTTDLAELVLAARLAGGVPLPLRLEPRHPSGPRLADRLDPSAAVDARALVRRELARVDDDGPDGARAGLARRGLLDDAGEVAPELVAALHVLAGGPLAAVLDVAVVRHGGAVRLRSWFGVAPGLGARLTTLGPLELELAWFEPRHWVPQLTRVVRVEPWRPGAPPLPLPDHVSLPSVLLAGAVKAHRERRLDALAALAVEHGSRVRLGDGRGARAAEPGEVAALLATLGDSCRGRLRLLTSRRDRELRGVAAWLLFDDGWHELRPGGGATSVLRRRDARDLGLLTRPLVEEVA